MQIEEFKRSEEDANLLWIENSIENSQGRCIHWCSQGFCLPEPPALVPRLVTMKMFGHLYSPGSGEAEAGSSCLSSSAEQKKLLLPSPALAWCSSPSLPGKGRAPLGWTGPVTLSLGAVHGCQGDGRSCDSLRLPPRHSLRFFSSSKNQADTDG